MKTMKNEIVFCDHCMADIDVTNLIDDYWESREEETLAVAVCSKCEKKNAIYFFATVQFAAREADEEDLEQFPTE